MCRMQITAHANALSALAGEQEGELARGGSLTAPDNTRRLPPDGKRLERVEQFLAISRRARPLDPPMTS